MANLKRRQPDEYGLSTTELGQKVMLDFEAVFHDLNKEEKERERNLVQRRRKAEDNRIAKELRELTEL